MAGIYTIGSKKGYELANSLQPGQSATATDGSVWTKNEDGSISVLHNGQQMQGQIAYQPSKQDQAAATPAPPAYKSPYSDKLGGVITELEQSGWKGWNKDEDEAWQAARQQHLREADRTAEDVLGRYAQNTGGIAGSAAITAASQAADYEKAKLTDRLPQFYENAYGRYLNDVAQKQNLAGLLMQAEGQAQSQHYNRIDYAMKKWQQLGYADQEVAGILGVEPGAKTSDQAYAEWKQSFQEQQRVDQLNKPARGGGGGGGSRGNSKADQDEEDGGTNEESPEVAENPNRSYYTPTAEDLSYAEQVYRSSGNKPEAVYEALKRKGYTPEQIDAIMYRLGY